MAAEGDAANVFGRAHSALQNVACGIALANAHSQIELHDLLAAIQHAWAGHGGNERPELARVLERHGIRPAAQPEPSLAASMVRLARDKGLRLPMAAAAQNLLREMGLDDGTLDSLLSPELVLELHKVLSSAPSREAVSQSKPSPAGPPEPAPIVEPLTHAQTKDAAARVRRQLERDFQDCGCLINPISAALLEISGTTDRRTSPLATYFFVGPSASGKSLAARCLGEALGHVDEQTQSGLVLEDGERPAQWDSKLFDLSSYTGENQSFGLVGLTAGYGEAKPGELTSFIREHPRAVIVLDHLDKAHPNTQNVLLQMFDTGVLTDRYGFFKGNDFKQESIAPPDVDVSQCIFVFIAGLDDALARNVGFFERLAPQPGQGKDALLDYLRKQRTDSYRGGGAPVYDAGLLSALGAGNLLLFPPLDESALRTLTRKGFVELAAQYQDTYSLRLEWTPNADLLIEASLLAHGAELDARKVSARGLRDLWLPDVDSALQNPQAQTDPRGPRLQIRFREGSLNELEPIKRRLGMMGVPAGAQTPDLVHCLRRHNRAVLFERELDRSRTPWVLTLQRPQMIIPQRAEDFQDRGALLTAVPSARFGDVRGHEVVKARLREILRLLKDPSALEQMRASPPSGMLLYGPPGTGKTLLAKALAGEADLPFMVANGVDVLDPAFTERLYERARHYAPSLVFLDEIDALGRRDHGGYIPAINSLLVQLDGFTGGASTVFTVAATNAIERIDPALVRPGRLGLLIEVPMLDREARRGFIERYRQLPGGEQLNVEALLDATAGLSGAELEAIRNEAACDLVRSGRATVDTAMLLDLVTTERYGPRARPLTAGQKRLTALHEAGHAVVARALFPKRRIEQISIVPRQRSLGMTVLNLEHEDRSNYTRDTVIRELAVMLAGRVAQQALSDSAVPDSGGSDDIHHATKLALLAASRWALQPDQVPLDYTLLGEDGQWRREPEVRAAAKDLLRDGESLARQTVSTSVGQIRQLAAQLMEEEIVRPAALDAPAAVNPAVTIDAARVDESAGTGQDNPPPLEVRT